jgi:hypothetical protein
LQELQGMQILHPPLRKSYRAMFFSSLYLGAVWMERLGFRYTADPKTVSITPKGPRSCTFSSISGPASLMVAQSGDKSQSDLVVSGESGAHLSPLSFGQADAPSMLTRDVVISRTLAKARCGNGDVLAE